MKSTVSTLTAYFDESGIHEDSSHCIVAGFVASDQEWNKFEKKGTDLFLDGALVSGGAIHSHFKSG